MRRLPPSFDAAVSAFREMTALPAEGDATRARVLASVGRDARRRSSLRRSAVPIIVGIGVLCFCAALTAAGLRWRAPAPADIATLAHEPRRDQRRRSETADADRSPRSCRKRGPRGAA